MTSNGTMPQSSPWSVSYVDFYWTVYVTLVVFPHSQKKDQRIACQKLQPPIYQAFLMPGLLYHPQVNTPHYLEGIRYTMLKSTLKECTQILND